MKKLAVILALFCTSYNLFAQEKLNEKEESKMKEYFFVMLKKGPARSQTKEIAAKLQEAHIAHINKMATDGQLAIAGPFGDDGDWRGIFIFKTKTIEEAKALVEQDPMIKAGRLVYEIHPWWTMKGAKLD